LTQSSDYKTSGSEFGSAAFWLWLRGRFSGERTYCLFVPVILVFVFNSLFNSQDIGVRHVLAVYPLLFVLASAVIARPLVALAQGERTGSHVIAATAAVFALVWFALGSLMVAPRYLQFFNELAGGPQNGHRLLVDANVDWGQDLIRLKQYLDNHEIAVVNLAYFGRVNPRVYGIDFRPVFRDAHGPTVVSASFLMGRPYFWFGENGEMQWISSGTYTWLQQYRPKARIGAMFLYDLP
jgi:hypothetical protein